MTTPAVCERCGAQDGQQHTWQEEDCILPHKTHSTARIGFCCRWCVDRHRLWLTETVELYATLNNVLEPGSIPDTTAEHQRPKKAPASPAPVRLDAWAMLRDADRLYRTGAQSDLPDVASVLATHAEVLFEYLGWTQQPPTTVTGAAAALIANIEALAGSPGVDEFDADLRWLRKALRAAHGVAEAQPVGRCPSLDGDGNTCGGPLWPVRDRMAVDCGTCGRHFDEPFLRHLGGMISA